MFFATPAIVCFFFWTADAFASRHVRRVDRTFVSQEGNDISMEAFYKGVDLGVVPAKATWYRHKALLLQGGKYQFSKNDSVLTIYNVAMEDAGHYNCTLDISNNSTFITDFTVVVRKNPIPSWALALIIVGLVIMLICAVLFFRCRKEITSLVSRSMPKRKKRKYTCETSFQV